MLTQGRLKEVLNYDPETGEFYWRVAVSNVARGARAGCADARGYWRIKVDGKMYTRHRLAWLYMHGGWPMDKIDHKNRVVGDDRIENLREATQAQNLANSKLPKNSSSGFKGVSYLKGAKKRPWCSSISNNGVNFYLGSFETPEKAYAAYCAKAKELHGEFFIPLA